MTLGVVPAKRCWPRRGGKLTGLTSRLTVTDYIGQTPKATDWAPRQLVCLLGLSVLSVAIYMYLNKSLLTSPPAYAQTAPLLFGFLRAIYSPRVPLLACRTAADRDGDMVNVGRPSFTTCRQPLTGIWVAYSG